MKYRTKKLVLEVMEYTGKNEKKFRKFINATAPIVLGMKKGVWALKFPDGESIFISKEILEKFFEPVEETVTDCNQSPELTDWCKRGAWLFDINEDRYAKVIEVDSDVMLVYLGEKEPEMRSRMYVNDCCVQASVRPWRNDELPYQVGQMFKYKGVTMLCLANRGDCLAFVGGNEYKATELLEKGFTSFCGNPCGVLEHE